MDTFGIVMVSSGFGLLIGCYLVAQFCPCNRQEPLDANYNELAFQPNTDNLMHTSIISQNTS
jgi:hypothetical protein